MPFQPRQFGNPAGSPKGSVNKQLAMLREAGEHVLPLVVERACNGDAEAQKLILERGLPRLKPIDAPMEFELPNSGNAEPVKLLLQQAATGEIPLSVAETIFARGLTVAKGGRNPAEALLHRNAYLTQLQMTK